MTTGFSLCVAAAALQCACGDPASQIGRGMREERVRELLGAPTLVLTDPVDVKGYLVDAEECATLSVKVLIYERSALRDDVFIGVNGQGVVECKRGGKVLKR